MTSNRSVTVCLWLFLLFAGMAGQKLEGAVETSYLIVNDATGQLSEEQVNRLSNAAEKTMGEILAFWAMNPKIEEFGKIRVELDRPRTESRKEKVWKTGRKAVEPAPAPAGKEVSTAVFYWKTEGGRKVRIVSVFGVSGEPQMMAQKLVHAIFPSNDKLIRNMLGVPMEVKFGNRMSFPMGGFSNDAWVLAFRQVGSYIPLAKLGPEHEDWGMSTKGNLPIVTNKAKQHVAYAESGSFGEYLLNTYGVRKLKEFYRLSQGKKRPWVEVFGLTLEQLEADWLKTLDAASKTEEPNIPILVKLIKANPEDACAEAQGLAGKARPKKQ